MNNIADYKRLEFELHEYLVQLKDMLLLLKGSENFLEKIDQDIERLKTKRFQVSVIGEFKRGKSSLINALLGANILPADVTPTTATINRIVYGNKATAVIYYKDGTTVDAEIDQLLEYVTKLTEASELESGTIKEAIIAYPVEICRNNIEIIDTPGLNDDERMTNVTLDMVNSIDAAIVTISAIAPVSKTEQSLIAKLIKRDNIGTIIFVITFVDQIDEEDRDRLFHNIKQRISVETLKLLQEEKDEVQAKAHRILDDFKVYGVSSKMALKAYSMNKQSLMKESGFEEFRNALYQTLISEQGMLALQNSIQSIYIMIEELEKQYERNKLEYHKELEATEALMRVIQEYKSTYLKPLDQGFAKVDDDLTNYRKSFLDMGKAMLPIFITELSALKTNANHDIIAALMKAVNRCKNYTNQTEINEIKDKIAKELDIVLSSYKVKIDSILDDARGHHVTMDTIGSLPLYKMGVEDIYQPIKIPEFVLTITLLEKKVTLSEYNIIHEIKEDINRAVTVYYDNWGLFLRQFRMWCFSTAELEVKTIHNYIKEQMTERARYYHRMLQVNDSNYETSNKIATEIISKVKLI